MKSILLSVIAAMIFSHNAQAQNEPSKNGAPAGATDSMGKPNMPPNGMPQNGMPNNGMPNNGSGNNGNANMNPPGKQPMNPPPPGKPNGPQWTPEKCDKHIPKVKKLAENCLRIKKEDKRRGCFDQMQTKLPPGFFEACGEKIQPMKSEMEAREKSMYPQQFSGMNGGHDNKQPQGEGKHEMGPHDGKNNMHPPQHKNVDCGKVSEKIKTEGDKCLKVKDTGKRKMCFDKVGDHIQKSGAEQACGDMLNTLKSEYQSKESQMYPGQPASIN